MKLLINALSTTNSSGRAVLVGHLTRLIKWAGDAHRFAGLHHAGNADLRELLPPAIEWHECPAWTAHWLGRTLWERTRLNGLLRKIGADLLFMASGTIVETCGIPQVSLCMNPWCLVPAVHVTRRDRVKAALQRRAYRSAVRRAGIMVYLSGFIGDAYEKNAGQASRERIIAYAGLHDDILAVTRADGARTRHEPNRIVCVSIMAPHKGVETVVEAVQRLRNSHGVPAELHLVGGWPDPAYRVKIQNRIAALGLGDAVTIHGFVSRQELFEQYARARVFCLMSWCESFGIPGVEAQSFGTPVVSSNCCAIPEVCGEGGLFPEPGDVRGTAEALRLLLTDDAKWRHLSVAARKNAEKYTYDQTARPLRRILEGVVKT